MHWNVQWKQKTRSLHDRITTNTCGENCYLQNGLGFQLKESFKINRFITSILYVVRLLAKKNIRHKTIAMIFKVRRDKSIESAINITCNYTCWYASKMYPKWPTSKANTTICILDSNSTDRETRSSHGVFEENVAASVVEPRKDDPRVDRRNQGKPCLARANKANCNNVWGCHIKIQIYQASQHPWTISMDMNGLISTPNMQPLTTIFTRCIGHWCPHLAICVSNFVWKHLRHVLTRAHETLQMQKHQNHKPWQEKPTQSAW